MNVYYIFGSDKKYPVNCDLCFTSEFLEELAACWSLERKHLCKEHRDKNDNNNKQTLKQD